MSRPHIHPFPLLTTCSLFALVGCAIASEASAPTPIQDADLEAAAQSGIAATPRAAPFLAPSNDSVKAVSAYGSGCPAGSWSVHVSEDGLAFDLIFSRFSVVLNRDTPAASQDCTLNLEWATPPDFSYRPTKVVAHGLASLKARQTAELTMSYAEGGRTRTASGQLVGPHAGAFRAEDDGDPSAGVAWSRCGARRTADLRIILTLTNSPMRDTGYVDLNIAAAIPEAAKIRVGFARSPCSENI